MANVKCYDCETTHAIADEQTCENCGQVDAIENGVYHAREEIWECSQCVDTKLTDAMYKRW